MLTTVRAAVSVLLLFGFYLLALALVGGLGYASYWLFHTGSGTGGVKVAALTLVAAAGVIVALWRMITARPELPPGVPLSPDQAPQVWQLVRELAGRADTSVPDAIVVIPDVNAAVTEQTRLLGLVGGPRRLYLGVPLLQALTVGQLRPVIAHELGHYSRRHTRLGEVAYRGQVAIDETLKELSGNIVGWLLRPYARLYLLVAAASNRRQELEADELSVQVAGRATAVATLREMPVVVAAWNFYETRYLDPGWENGFAPSPADFFGGFNQLLAARTAEIAEPRAEAPPARQSRWDSHPSIAVRVAAMESQPDSPVWTDNRPATDLFPAFDLLAEAVARTTVAYGNRRQLPWNEFTTAAWSTHEQRQADVVYRAAARIAGTGTAGLGTVLNLVAAGRLPQLAVEFFPHAPGPDAARRFADPMQLLLRVAAARSGVGRWLPSWTGEPPLVGLDGRDLELEPIAALAVAPETLPEARARLAGLGIDVATAVQVDAVATAHGGAIVGGLANVEVDGVQHDVLILDNGLILRPCPKKTEGGKLRLAQFAQAAPVPELAAANRFLSHEDIAAATIDRRVPIRVSLTLHNGQTVKVYEKWSGESLTKSSADDLRDAVTPFVRTPADR